MLNKQLISFWTMVSIGLVRFRRSAIYVILPPLVTNFLYFTIFGKVIGNHIGNINNVSYEAYLVPGLIMMTVITTSFNGSLGPFFFSKFVRNIEELIISPTSTFALLLGQTAVGVIRGLTTGILVTIIAAFFVSLNFHHLGVALLTAFLTSTLFSQLGITNAIFAKKWDDISIISTFILTPLTYLGGVFFSLQDLPVFWQHLAMYNPIVYIINAFRFGFLGFSDIPISKALFFAMLCLIIVTLFNYILLKRGVGIRT